MGCGRIAKNHREAIAAHGAQAELVAVCDPDAESLRAMVEATGAAGFASLSELLAGSDADVVVLATPAACTRSRPAPSLPPAATC